MESTAFAALCRLCGLRGESSRGRSCVLPALPSSTRAEVRFGARSGQPARQNRIPDDLN